MYFISMHIESPWGSPDGQKGKATPGGGCTELSPVMVVAAISIPLWTRRRQTQWNEAVRLYRFPEGNQKMQDMSQNVHQDSESPWANGRSIEASVGCKSLYYLEYRARQPLGEWVISLTQM